MIIIKWCISNNILIYNNDDNNNNNNNNNNNSNNKSCASYIISIAGITSKGRQAPVGKMEAVKTVII